MNFDWPIFIKYIWPPTAFEDPRILQGLMATVGVAVLAMIIATGIGLVGALARLSRRRVFRALAAAYVTYFRGTPILVQLFLIYFASIQFHIYGFPPIELGPWEIAGALQAGVIAIALNHGAQMTEIIRAGIIGIDRGQMEAARAIGMTYPGAMRWIVLPQAVRIILPSFGNQLNASILVTPILITIGGQDLFGVFLAINGVNYHPIELFLDCSAYILVISTAWAWVQGRLERRVGVSTAAVRPRANAS
jgi:polar amino acid transport system permease protein